MLVLSMYDVMHGMCSPFSLLHQTTVRQSFLLPFSENVFERTLSSWHYKFTIHHTKRFALVQLYIIADSMLSALLLLLRFSFASLFLSLSSVYVLCWLDVLPCRHSHRFKFYSGICHTHYTFLKRLFWLYNFEGHSIVFFFFLW